MPTILDAITASLDLVISFDQSLLEIIALSMRITMIAVIISCVLGFLSGTALAVFRFRGRGMIIIFVNSLMGLPPVVVGLGVYLMLSAAGPFGPLRLLYTPTAMIIAQTILVTPIIAALTRQVIGDLANEYNETLQSMHATQLDTMGTLLWDARFTLLTAALAGLGRALSEVGAVMIVGGNINHFTRVMTTSIALETSKGDLALALGLGIILLILTIIINATAFVLRSAFERHAYV